MESPSPRRITCVFFGTQGSHYLISQCPKAAEEAFKLLIDFINTVANEHNGELRTGNEKGDILYIFSDPEDAFKVCMKVQIGLNDISLISSTNYQLEWSEEVLATAAACVEERDNIILYRGPRVRCGIHTGVVESSEESSRSLELGAIRLTAAISTVASGGMIVCTEETLSLLKDTANFAADLGFTVIPIGHFTGGTVSVDMNEIFINILHRDHKYLSRDDTYTPEEWEKFSHPPKLIEEPEEHIVYKNDEDLVNVEAVSQSAIQEPQELSETVENILKDALLSVAPPVYNGKGERTWVIIPKKDIQTAQKIPGNNMHFMGFWKSQDKISVEVRKRVVQLQNSNTKSELVLTSDHLGSLDHTCIQKFLGLVVELQRPESMLVWDIFAFESFHFLRNVLHDTSIDIPWSTRISMMQDITSALEYLHSRNWAYRDLKSPSIKVSDGSKVKLSDFGSLSTDMCNSRALMSQVGTSYWVAPEIISGKPYTTKADIYSLAVVMWEIMNRIDPYPMNASIRIIFDQVIEGIRPCISTNCPSILNNLVSICWSEDPEVRPNADSILDALDSFDTNSWPPPPDTQNATTKFDINTIKKASRKVTLDDNFRQNRVAPKDMRKNEKNSSTCIIF